jgi:hypothetical protein
MQVFRSRRLVERSLLTLGIGLVLAAIVGGGLEVAGLEVPVVSSVVRQILLAALGVAVAVLSLWVKSDQAPEKKPEADAPHVTRTRQRGLVAAMPSDVVVDQPTEVWVQVCLSGSSGFVESLPQYTSSGEEIGKSDARRSPGSVQFIEREGHLLNAVLSVTVSSPFHFEVVSGTRTISLSPRHDSAKLVFQVVPTEVVARARVFVSVTQEQDGALVTVAEVSVGASVLPPGGAVQVPPSVNLLWNVAQQGVTDGVPIGLGVMLPNRLPSRPREAEEEDPLGIRPGSAETVQPSPSWQPEGRPSSRPSSPRAASRRWLVLAAVAVSFALVAFVVWKLQG